MGWDRRPAGRPYKEREVISAEGGDYLFGEASYCVVQVGSIEVDDNLVDADVGAGLYPLAPIVHVAGHGLALASYEEVGLIDGELRDEVVPCLLPLGRYELDENSLLDIVEVAARVEAVLA